MTPEEITLATKAARRRTWDPDAIQAALLHVVESRHRAPADPAERRKWIRTVARCGVLRHWQRENPISVRMRGRIPPPIFVEADPPARESSPEAAAASKELLALVDSRLLPVLEGVSLSEAARGLGLGNGGLKRVYYRTLERLAAE